ncbi:hypothetical protein KC19_2G237800 [Ceratodon purpureus]|uniref:Secreted protein n=1 Tax=Ceratodon purpureus TaxID=3225 RepID=A0A8T0IZP6_CERPU|nr:hypothetical protein KC19_2G237800 [Ceratodon purpureus]
MLVLLVDWLLGAVLCVETSSSDAHAHRSVELKYNLSMRCAVEGGSEIWGLFLLTASGSYKMRSLVD